jgi:hypothetical protein
MYFGHRKNGTGYANIAEIFKTHNRHQNLMNGLTKIKGIRKVKVVYPSPFYDGTYHPPLF